MKYTVITIAVAVCVLVASIAVAGTPPAPIYVSNSALGGAALNGYTPGVAGGKGTNNIGLLVRTYGVVTYVNSSLKYFYINDGSNRADGTRRADNAAVLGVRVSYGDLAGTNVITPPIENSRVAVTGVISTCLVDTLVQPNVRARHQDDLLLIP